MQWQGQNTTVPDIATRKGADYPVSPKQKKDRASYNPIQFILNILLNSKL